MSYKCFELKLQNTVKYVSLRTNKQEGPEGPGTLTWDRRFLNFPFFIALSTTGNTWEV